MPTPARTLKVTARLPDGRLLIAHLDPQLPAHHSPLRRALHTAGIPLTSRDQ
ncbi:hypothetical protein [Streptomyces lavendofoliae]|uniref:Uncharacterized protein n=1 Tax=Streptomyces lavendofoliae TaxID=67314 RepID=A0A918I2L9_9ACTN|nr:hypothetical protein [Streptomyces lavendofoliae]GGU62637.1 hypothetical protein GCM10010274_59300 [Streptomyces lavendofoliae]